MNDSHLNRPATRDELLPIIPLLDISLGAHGLGVACDYG